MWIEKWIENNNNFQFDCFCAIHVAQLFATLLYYCVKLQNIVLITKLQNDFGGF